tara:strand:+ start:301 stop:462 length:162 start_codon:yes stop_codon:yes gene_type:complete
VPYQKAREKCWIAWVYFFIILEKCVCKVALWLPSTSPLARLYDRVPMLILIDF